MRNVILVALLSGGCACLLSFIESRFLNLSNSRLVLFKNLSLVPILFLTVLVFGHLDFQSDDDVPQALLGVICGGIAWQIILFLVRHFRAKQKQITDD